MKSNRLRAACKTLGIAKSVFCAFLEKPNQRNLDLLQAQAKQCWKKLAFKLHPDRGGNAEEFKRALAAYQLVQGIQKPHRPVPMTTVVIQVQVRWQTYHYHGGTQGSGTATSWYV